MMFRRLLRFEDPIFVGTLAIIIIAGLLAFGFWYTAHAQDATPQPTPVTSPNLPPDTSVPTTPDALIAVYTFLGGTLLVNVVTSLLKLFIPATVSATTIKQWVVVLATAVYVALAFAGHTDWFGRGADLLTELLPMVAGIIGALQGSSLLHDVTSKVNVPLLVNYKRPDTA